MQAIFDMIDAPGDAFRLPVPYIKEWISPNNQSRERMGTMINRLRIKSINPKRPVEQVKAIFSI